ncbi:MAG: PKD domain-containing protein, partial [Pseudomonadota bacterium]
MQKRKLSLYLMVAMVLCLIKVDAPRAVWKDVTPAGVSTETLFAVWGSSPSDVYAVGNSGTVLHYNGTAWSAETSNTTAQLLSIWGLNSTNIYAVGKEDPVAGTATLLHKTSTGTTWGKEPLKDYKTDASYDYDIYTVWGYAANKVYVGDMYGEFFLFDGNGWSKIEPGPGVGSIPITGIWAANSTNLFVTASTGIARFNGTEWAHDDAGNTGSVNEIWGTGIDNIYLAGEKGFISRYNGSAWLAVSSGSSKDLNSIHGSSANNIFAVGSLGTIVHNKGAGFVDESFTTVNDLFGVWVSSDGQAAFAVGTDGIILKYEPDPTTTTTTVSGNTTTTTVTGGNTTTTISGGNTTTTTPGGNTTTTSTPGGTTTTIPGNVTTSTVPPGEVGADFIGAPLTGKEPLSVQFTNFSGGDIATYQWVFGDGGVSTEKNPSHIYQKKGTYSVILTVIGTNAKTATKTRDSYINVKSKCILVSSLDSPSRIETLRSIRDTNLDNFSGMLITAVYYRNAPEMNELL